MFGWSGFIGLCGDSMAEVLIFKAADICDLGNGCRRAGILVMLLASGGGCIYSVGAWFGVWSMCLLGIMAAWGLKTGGFSGHGVVFEAAGLSGRLYGVRLNLCGGLWLLLCRAVIWQYSTYIVGDWLI